MTIGNAEIQGLFDEAFNDVSGYAGLAAAPVLPVQTLNGTYTVAKRWGGLQLEEEGYDPLVPLSWEAGSRPVRDEFETRLFNAERYSEHYFIDRNQGLSIKNANGIDIAQRGATILAQIHRDRHEYKVASVYKDPTSYATTDAVTIGAGSSVTEAGFMSKILSAQRSIQTQGVGARKTALVVPPSVADALRYSTAFRQAVGGGTPGFVGSDQMLSDWLRNVYGLELITSSAIVRNNKTAPATPVGQPIWEAYTGGSVAPWAAVVALTDNASFNPGFATTVAFSPTFDASRVAMVRHVEETDPLGEKIIAESVYKVDVANDNLGVYFSVTISN